MQVLAFILAIAALVMFLAEALPRRNWLAWGLAALTAAWIIQLVWHSASTVTIN